MHLEGRSTDVCTALDLAIEGGAPPQSASIGLPLEPHADGFSASTAAAAVTVTLRTRLLEPPYV